MGVNMKMIQQMQTRLEKMQRELAETVVEGTAGGGVVTAQVTGAREFRGYLDRPERCRPGRRRGPRRPDHRGHSGRDESCQLRSPKRRWAPLPAAFVFPG